MKPILLLFCSLFFSIASHSQSNKKVLFIGNSYTASNNLPALVQNMATSTGDVLTYDSNTPGGYRFINHVSNATTQNKINAEDWDYVVLQAQSQETSFPQAQMEAELYPNATALSNAIRANNPCSQPMFYMTWGRENGDANNCPYLPWVCTYESMDDVIQATYTFMADSNDAELAPVGAVWRYLRTNHPNINLYSGDGSHPSLAGSYAAACAFYTMIYKKDPTLISWNASLSAAEASTIKTATQTVVFNLLSDWDFTTPPALASFTEVVSEDTIAFTNTSDPSESIYWDFGDGTTATEMNPEHTYTESGTYTVSLTVTACGKSSTTTKEFTIDLSLSTDSFSSRSFSVFPNPTSHYVTLTTANNYQNINVQLIDITGKLVLSKNHHSENTIKLDLSEFRKGVYFLHVNADQKKLTKKIILQ